MHHLKEQDMPALIKTYFEHEGTEQELLQADLDRLFDDPQVRRHISKLIALLGSGR